MNKESAGIIKAIFLLLFLMGAVCCARGQVIIPHYGDADSIKATMASSTIGDKLRVTIYFRWDKENIDSTYLTNAQALHRIDSIMKQKSAEYIDTLHIATFASPEGDSLYNQKLSERRAEAFRQYLLKTYPRFAPSIVMTQGKGENWDEFHRLAEAGPNLTLSQRESRWIALRTNLLYDAIGAANVGIEIPIRQHLSIIADFAYSYWRSSNHLYALQALEYGIEGRYWFGVSKARNAGWRKPFRGWNVGIYGRYWQRFDVQWIDGVQGDGSWSAGATVGYAFPIAKGLTFEPSLGAGYFFTSEYRHYHRPEYDAQNKYHLMWQQTGAWSGLSLTKVRFSLVWLIECKKRGGGR